MRAILMAAGVGSRLSRSVKKPECVLDVDLEKGEVLVHVMDGLLDL